MRLFADAQKTIENTFDEARDLIVGEDNKGDRTPIGYYSTKWIIGMHQLRNLFDWLYDEDRKDRR
jgi:hypothetical protein